MWAQYEKAQDTPQEQTEEQKQTDAYRACIMQKLYSINSPDILNYIKIIVDDICKEEKSGVSV